MAKKSYPSREERMKDLNQRLEQGIRDVFESERFRDYLAVMSRFHTYSARNVLLIHMQRPNATRVASAKRWKEQFERFINKGEKAIYIMAPIPIVKTVERQKLDPDTKAPVLDEDGQVITEKREVQVPRFRPVPVFDVSQTNGKPLPQLAQDLTGDVEQYEAFMEALRRTAPVPMEIKPMAENLDGYFSLDEQSISIRAGMSEVQTVCAAVHEITHSILHNQRGVREDKAVRTAQELEAESVSYVVCQYCGVETGANSFGYLASWSKDKELSELRACLATINKTANQLIGEIDRHFAEVCKERGIELEQENAPKISANFEGLDTPEQFAAALYDYMAELEAAGMLQHPYSLDPREQAIVEIMEELRAGHFADIRNTLDRVGEQTGLPTAVAMLDRLEKLSDIRDQGLTFRLEANPNATSYQDQGYLQAGEWNGDSYIPREVIYVGPTDRCRELLYQLEAGDMTARQVRALDQTDSKELEALYLLDDAAYLHIQLRDEGYDYTLYDKETMRLRDGGVIDAEDVALSPIKHPLAAVREEVFDTMGERPEKVEAVPLELVEKLQEAQLEPPAVSSREKLIEHFAAEDAVLFDTELDTYPMPDPSMSMEHLTEAGYTENDLLPLSLDTAELTLCIENGLSIVEDPKPKGQTYDKWLGTQAKPSHRELLRQAIDRAMERGPEDLEALLKLLQEAGFSAKRRGKDIAFRAPGWKNVVCLKTLGDGYGEADLCAALTGKHKHVPARRAAPAPAVPKVNLLVDIQAKLRAGKGAGYARWASKFNLKQMAQTLNYLNDHGLLDYKVLAEKTVAATARRNELSEKIKAAEKRMAEIAVLRTHIVNYAKTRDTYAAYRKAGYSPKFRSEHEADILLHQAAKQAFDQLNVKKLPKMKALQAEYAALLAEKKEAYAELRKARDEARELLTVKANVDRVLQDTGRGIAQEKEHSQR